MLMPSCMFNSPSIELTGLLSLSEISSAVSLYFLLPFKSFFNPFSESWVSLITSLSFNSLMPRSALRFLKFGLRFYLRMSRETACILLSAFSISFIYYCCHDMLRLGYAKRRSFSSLYSRESFVLLFQPPEHLSPIPAPKRNRWFISSSLVFALLLPWFLELFYKMISRRFC